MICSVVAFVGVISDAGNGLDFVCVYSIFCFVSLNAINFLIYLSTFREQICMLVDMLRTFMVMLLNCFLSA